MSFLDKLKSWFAPKTQEIVAAPAPGAYVEKFDADHAEFFKRVRDRFGALRQGQVDGFNSIFAEWNLRGGTDLRWLAYMLATVWHETAATMQPIAEYGKGRGRSYGKPDRRTGLIYYGRGYVQLTHFENYQKYGIEKTPEKALEPSVAAEIMFDGMRRGAFTGKRLSDYFNEHTNDPINARRIINGIDKAQLIAKHHANFLAALEPAAVKLT